MATFKAVLQKLDNLEKETSSNNKQLLLESYLNCELFMQVVFLAVSEDKKFKCQALPSPDQPLEEPDTEEIFTVLKKMAKARGVKDEVRMELANACGNCEIHREVTRRIINKDLRCGVGLKMLTKVDPEMFFKTPYQRCSTEKKIGNIDWNNARVDIKADGMFAYLTRDEFTSRRGKSIKSQNIYGLENYVLMGELVVHDDQGKDLPRKTSNGLVSSWFKGGEEPEGLHYYVWDVITEDEYYNKKSERSLEERAKDLDEFMKAVPHIDIIGYKRVYSFKDAENFYLECRGEGEEGAIIKNLSAVWKDGTSPDTVKMKHFAQAEFKIVGLVEGQGKYEGKLGSLIVESSDGKIKAKVGSGFSDAQREDTTCWKTGGIVTIQFENVVTSKDREDLESLFLPTFIEDRFLEKTEADSSEYIKSLIK